MEKYIQDIKNFYDKKFNAFGPNPKGLDWNDLNAQENRLNNIIKCISKKNNLKINDFGCGYGHLIEILNQNNFIKYHYVGYDISNTMITFSQEKYKKYKNIAFINGDILALKEADYTIASGVFNKIFMSNKKKWEDYLFSSIEEMYKKSEIGIVCNFLTDKADKSYKRSDLYYASPESIIKFSAKLSKYFCLHHDYGAYDFLIKINKRID
jgi:SAM-dependent methyltransferase